MKLSIALAASLFILPLLVDAQYGAPAPAPAPAPDPTTSETRAPSSPTAASNSSTITVEVAPGDQLTYSPTNFTAGNGTTVTFVFPSDDPHSVTQSAFANPCVYLAASGGNPAGFDSGLQTGKQFSLSITNDQIPVYFFCKSGAHCGLGMVGAINAPTSGNTYAAYLSAAKALGSNEKPISDSGPVTGGVGAVATGTPAIGAANSTTTKSSSSAGQLSTNGFFALLATAFGIALA